MLVKIPLYYWPEPYLVPASELSKVSSRKTYCLGFACGQGVSFVNIFADDTPIIILGTQASPTAPPKDTAPDFVTHLVDPPLARQIVECAIGFSPGVDEMAQIGLREVPSLKGGSGESARRPLPWSAA